MRKLRRGGIAAMLLIGLSVPLSGLAAAPSNVGDIAIKVSYADLNVENAAGARVLYARLKRASEEACDVETARKRGSLTDVAKARTCINETLSAAVEKIDRDTLTQVHKG